MPRKPRSTPSATTAPAPSTEKKPRTFQTAKQRALEGIQVAARALVGHPTLSDKAVALGIEVAHVPDDWEPVRAPSGPLVAGDLSVPAPKYADGYAGLATPFKLTRLYLSGKVGLADATTADGVQVMRLVVSQLRRAPAEQPAAVEPQSALADEPAGEGV